MRSPLPASNVIDSSLSSLCSLRGGLAGGGGLTGEGQGTFHPTCHMLHYHMVFRPKGTSQMSELKGRRGKERDTWRV